MPVKKSPPTLRHYLIEKCREERELQELEEEQELAEEMMYEEMREENEAQQEEEGEGYELDEAAEEDDQYDWYAPSNQSETVPAPVLHHMEKKGKGYGGDKGTGKVVYQKGPPAFVPLYNTYGQGKGKGKSKGKMPMKGMYDFPKGFATPLTNPGIYKNPLSHKGVQQAGWSPPKGKGWNPTWKGPKGWIPPAPMPMDAYQQMNQHPFNLPPPNVQKGEAVQMHAQLQNHPMVPPSQMVPVYGYAPYVQMATGDQPQSSVPVARPQVILQQGEMKEARPHKRHRKRRDSVDTTDTESTSVEETKKRKRHRKREHVVWLNVGGQKIPATYKA